jgi:hypothetical protein
MVKVETSNTLSFDNIDSIAFSLLLLVFSEVIAVQSSQLSEGRTCLDFGEVLLGVPAIRRT